MIEWISRADMRAKLAVIGANTGPAFVDAACTGYNIAKREAQAEIAAAEKRGMLRAADVVEQRAVKSHKVDSPVWDALVDAGAEIRAEAEKV